MMITLKNKLVDYGKSKSDKVSSLSPILAEAQKFLSWLDPSETAFTFQIVGDTNLAKDSSNPGWKHGRLEDLAPWLIENNEMGCGVFVMVNRGDGVGRSAKNVTQVRAVFLDLDGPSLDPVLASKVKPNMIVESSPAHFHVYWRVHDCQLDQFSSVQDALAANYGGDTIKDLPRVMRLPGFYHRKGQPFLVRMITT